MADATLLLGLDVGTTAVKAGAFRLDGKVAAQASLAYPTRRLPGGIVEQDAAAWTDAVERVLQSLLRTIDAGSVVALGICSQVNTHVFVDARGDALLPAIVWQDGRAAAEAAAIDAQVGEQQRLAWWGAPLPIDASHPLARMAWVARHHPDLWARTRYVLSPKDYCLLRMTGNAVADPVASFGLVDMQGRYIDALLELVPGAAERVPPLHRFDAPAGIIRSGALQGAVAPVGTMDAWAGLFGAGATEPGRGVYLSGTSEIVALASAQRVGAPGIISFLPVDGLHVHAGPTQSGGDSLRWLSALTGRSLPELLAAAASVDRDLARVLFLPHLQGERAPLWDAHSRGAFVGLQGDVEAGGLALAVLEGVAASVALLFDAACAAAGQRYPSLRLGGGGARSDLWCQIRADTLGIPLDRMNCLDSGALGAALMAGVGRGVFATVADAAAGMVHVERRFVPDPRFAERGARIRQVYGQLYEALRPINLALGF